MRKAIIFLFVAVAVAGCAVGPDYKRPVIEAPQSFRYEPKEVADTANTEWWKQFNDPVLDQLIAEALANNKSVKIAAANVALAAGHPHDHALRPLSAGGLRRGGFPPASVRERSDCPAEQNPFSTFRYSAARAGKSTSGAVSGGSAESAQASLLRERRGAARGHPFPGCPGRQCLYPAARSGRATPDFPAQPQELRRVREAL